MSSFASLLIALSLSAPNDEAFRSQVRPTEPLAPADQQRTFHLPPGFEIQLFASEPDLQKPMNMALEASGRLWVSGSVEYPYAAVDRPGRDTIKVLEDTDNDGRADKVTTFVDDLNIPMGLYPYRDGVVAYSIPNIWFFRDTDGDGRADRREVLYGPLGTPRDTHGMQNAFRRGFDGWLYINHGFANESTITARDNSSISLHSGNTYRVRLDGSHVEHVTWGQVNPFGSTFLPSGDLITADCHSRPLTLLIRGAYYPSFGKPHDGLGFGPDLMQHSHGSTAIAGVAYYTGDNFPAEYQGHLFVGNVMTSRINHDVLQYTGSTPQAIEQPDFLTTDDPWFRPVDLQIGPDGALYIADFYNRIIGHYEVSLDHPGRDKRRARIWRIVYRGNKPSPPANRPPDLARADVDQLIAALGSVSLTQRMLASDQLSDRIGPSAVPRLVNTVTSHANDLVRLHSLWVLHRLGGLREEIVQQASRDRSELVRVHALRVLSESTHWRTDLTSISPDEHSSLVRRAAADAVAQGGGYDVAKLLGLLSVVPPEDSLLRHNLRLAIRNQLRTAEAWKSIQAASVQDEQLAELADLAVAVPSPESAAFLFNYVKSRPVVPRHIESQLSHLCTSLSVDRLADVVQFVRDKAQADIDLQFKLLMLVHQRTEQRGVGSSDAIRSWGADVAARLLKENEAADLTWQNQSRDNPWGLEPRNCEDGQTGVVFLSSLPGGERQTGIIRSRTFVLPPKLSFFLCGHLGYPNQPAAEKNFVRLCLAGSGEMICKAMPPRTDTARRVDWDLSRHAGQSAYLEVVDGLDLPAYAWLAISRFDPPVATVPTLSPAKLAEHKVAACAIVATLKLGDFRPVMTHLVADSSADWSVRAAAGRAELAFASRPLVDALLTIVAEPSLDAILRETICRQVVAGSGDASMKLLSDVMKSASARVQKQLSDALASTSLGAESLLVLVEQGHAAARLLQDPTLKQKLTLARPDNWETRLGNITASLPPLSDQLQRLIDERRRAFHESSADLNRGQESFRKHCANCHQISGQGSLVGPQLDGIGGRGTDRIIEDVVDPNRNVDAAFHVSLLALVNGQVVPGLFRRDEGNSVILANQEGKEFAILKADIEEQTKSNSSLMPTNFGELLKPDEFRDLIGYLLTQRPAK